MSAEIDYCGIDFSALWSQNENGVKFASVSKTHFELNLTIELTIIEIKFFFNRKPSQELSLRTYPIWLLNQVQTLKWLKK